jgi:hypothetical protein
MPSLIFLMLPQSRQLQVCLNSLQFIEVHSESFVSCYAAPVFGSSSLHSRDKQKGNVLPSGTKKVSDGRTFASPQAAKRAMVSLSPTASTLQSSDSRDPEKINSILALLADAGYTGLNPEDLGKLNPPDKYETELHVMAEVRGYFQVSYKVRTTPISSALID